MLAAMVWRILLCQAKAEVALELADARDELLAFRSLCDALPFASRISLNRTGNPAGA
jgi:hypothetical protein